MFTLGESGNLRKYVKLQLDENKNKNYWMTGERNHKIINKNHLKVKQI